MACAGEENQVLRALRKLFGGKTPQGDSSPSSNPQRPGAESRGFVLLARSVADPMEDLQGFPEAYYCTRCEAYFAMAWREASSSAPAECRVIDPAEFPSGPGAADRQSVFCPTCGSDYAEYGLIPGRDPGSPDPGDVQILESQSFPFPPDAACPEDGFIKKGDLVIERIVFIVTGEFPPDVEPVDVTYSLAQQLLDGLPGDLGVSPSGGIRIHLLRTNAVSDEDDWVLPILENHVYTPETFGNRTYMTNGPIDLNPPLGQMLCCLLQPPFPKG